jgi:hypothetical protein
MSTTTTWSNALIRASFIEVFHLRIADCGKGISDSGRSAPHNSPQAFECFLLAIVSGLLAYSVPRRGGGAFIVDKRRDLLFEALRETMPIV